MYRQDDYRFLFFRSGKESEWYERHAMIGILIIPRLRTRWTILGFVGMQSRDPPSKPVKLIGLHVLCVFSAF